MSFFWDVDCYFSVIFFFRVTLILTLKRSFQASKTKHPHGGKVPQMHFSDFMLVHQIKVADELEYLVLLSIIFCCFFNLKTLYNRKRWREETLRVIFYSTFNLIRVNVDEWVSPGWREEHFLTCGTTTSLNSVCPTPFLPSNHQNPQMWWAGGVIRFLLGWTELWLVLKVAFQTDLSAAWLRSVATARQGRDCSLTESTNPPDGSG